MYHEVFSTARLNLMTDNMAVQGNISMFIFRSRAVERLFFNRVNRAINYFNCEAHIILFIILLLYITGRMTNSKLRTVVTNVQMDSMSALHPVKVYLLLRQIYLYTMLMA